MTDARTRSLLLACLHQDPQRLAETWRPASDSSHWDGLLDLATEQRVRPLVHHRLRDAPFDVPDRVRRALEQTTRSIGLRNLRFQRELASVAAALATQQVPVIVLKGAHLIAEIYRGVALREMSDLDILVRREHLASAVETVMARGYHPSKAFSIEVDATLSHHLTRFKKPDHGDIEIHWSITIPREAHHVDPAQLWERATPVTTAGVGVLALSREDLLLHLCGHTSYQHQFRFGLRPFCDMAATIARDPACVDWPRLVQRARDWQWERGVYLSFALARDLVGAAVPAEVLDELKPAGVDAAVLVTATAQVFAAPVSEPLQPAVARLAGTESLWGRLRHLRARILIPRRELAQTYGLSPESRRLPLYYLLRVRDLMERHSALAARLLLKKDPGLTAVADRTNVLRQWLQ